jgi:hypothetical protein
MNQFLLYLLIGAGIGLLLIAPIVWIRGLIVNTMERRKIKNMIAKGEILQPLDKVDYESNKWAKEIDVAANEEQLKNLDNKVFNRDGARKQQ